MKTYELQPTNNQKSFYGKATVIIENDTETLKSYSTLIIKRTKSGELVRLWDGWSATTGKHIAAFCGLNKKQFLALPLNK